MNVLYPRCAVLHVHKATIISCALIAACAPVQSETLEFPTTTPALLSLSHCLTTHSVTHVAIEATRVYCKPASHVLHETF